MLRGVQAIIIRSKLSLLLSPQELGSAFAFLEVLVSLVPFAVAPVSTSLYNYTIDFLPGPHRSQINRLDEQSLLLMVYMLQEAGPFSV